MCVLFFEKYRCVCHFMGWVIGSSRSLPVTPWYVVLQSWHDRGLGVSTEPQESFASVLVKIHSLSAPPGTKYFWHVNLTDKKDFFLVAQVMTQSAPNFKSIIFRLIEFTFEKISDFPSFLINSIFSHKNRNEQTKELQRSTYKRIFFSFNFWGIIQSDFYPQTTNLIMFIKFTLKMTT